MYFSDGIFKNRRNCSKTSGSRNVPSYAGGGNIKSGICEPEDMHWNTGNHRGTGPEKSDGTTGCDRGRKNCRTIRFHWTGQTAKAISGHKNRNKTISFVGTSSWKRSFSYGNPDRQHCNDRTKIYKRHAAKSIV